MSLPNDQFREALEAAMLAELREGRVPDIKTLEQQIARRFDPSRLGKSQFVAMPIPSRSVGDPSLLNANFERLSQDLAFAFSFIQRERERATKLMASSQDRVETLLSRIKRVEREIELIAMMLPVQADIRKRGSLDLVNPFGYTHLETFADTSGLDASKTTAAIDRSGGGATIGFSRNGHGKVKLGALSVSFRGGAEPTVLLGSELENLLDDALDTEWRHVVKGSGTITAELKLSLPSARSMTKLEVQSNAPQGSTMRLFASFDGVNEFPIGDAAFVSDTRSWLLPASPFQFFRLEMTKEFADVGGDQYHFGLRRIELFEDTFSPSSQIVTVPFEVPRFSHLAFCCEANIPDGTMLSLAVADARELESAGESAWREVPRFDPANPRQDDLYAWSDPQDEARMRLVARVELSRSDLQSTPLLRWFSVMTSGATS